jgi:hypothetical protein
MIIALLKFDQQCIDVNPACGEPEHDSSEDENQQLVIPGTSDLIVGCVGMEILALKPNGVPPTPTSSVFQCRTSDMSPEMV